MASIMSVLFVMLSVALFGYMGEAFGVQQRLVSSNASVSSLAPVSSTSVPKVYVYDIGNAHILKEYPACANSMFGAEVWIPKFLQSHGAHTTNPHEADFFYVPVYSECLWDYTDEPSPDLGKGARLVLDAVNYLSKTSEFWRTRPEDHIFTFTHDLGPCMAYVDCDDALRLDVVGAVSNAITLQTFAVNENHPCFRPGTAIAIPPYVAPMEQSYIDMAKGMKDRKYLSSYVGTTNWVSYETQMEGMTYANGMRELIANKYGAGQYSQSQFYFPNKILDRSVFLDVMVNSRFCLCVRGFAPWSPRMVESMMMGCIPVIIADEIRLPFSDLHDWQDFSVRVPENVVRNGGLVKFLENIPHDKITAMQRRLGSITTSFLYTQSGGAIIQILTELANLRDRRFQQKSHFESFVAGLVDQHHRFEQAIQDKRPQCHGQRNVCLNGHIAPELFVIGASRAATTRVLNNINKSFFVHFSRSFGSKPGQDKFWEYQPHFLDCDKGSGKIACQSTGKSWWLDRYPLCVESGGRSVYIDGSSSYLQVDGSIFPNSAPAMISTYYGNLKSKLKFVVMIRSPMNRAQSAFYAKEHQQGIGIYDKCKHQGSFTSYVQGYVRHGADPCRYISGSLYASHLAKWIHIGYSPSQFTVVPQRYAMGQGNIKRLTEYVWNMLGLVAGFDVNNPKAPPLFNDRTLESGDHPTLRADVSDALQFDWSVAMKEQIEKDLDTYAAGRYIPLKKFKPDAATTPGEAMSQLFAADFKLYGYGGDKRNPHHVSEWLVKMWNKEHTSH